MKSIKTRFLLTSVLSMLILSLALGAISVAVVTTVSNNDANYLMKEICNSNAESIDRELGMVSQSVDLLSMIILDELRSMASLYDVDYARDFVDVICEKSIPVAMKTEGVMAVYFRINPKVVDDDTIGFFYTRKGDEEEFSAQPITKIWDYEKDDREHVGWYYEPVEAGHAIWMSPYYNKNVDVDMISYIVPCYLDGTMIGVIGMDCDFGKILASTQGTSVYGTSYVKLACLQNERIYSLAGQTILQEEITESLKGRLQQMDTSENLYKTEEKGIPLSYSFSTLANDMKLIIYVPTAEISYARNSMLINMVVVVLFVFAIVFVLTIVYVEKMIAPLTELTEAMENYTRGDGGIVEIKVDSKDEIGRLANSYSLMMETIHSNMEAINAFARTDALTRLGNKQAYLEMVRDIKGNLDGKWMRYGIAVFDLNNLKEVNDRYGHELGDALVKASGKYISEIFTGCKAYRIGGDEFCVILSEEENERREELESTFLSLQADQIFDEEKGLCISIAIGMASAPKDGCGYDEVFTLADQRMYQTKKRQKQEKK